MNWDKPLQDHAAAEGWQLAEIVDNGDTHTYYVCAPLDSRFKNTQEATGFVVEQARRGSAVHQRALSLVASSRIRGTPKRKPRR